MNRKAALLVSTIAASVSVHPALGQGSDVGPGNPTLLQAIQNLQTSVNALQGTVNKLSSTVNNIVSNGVAAQPRLFYLTTGTVNGAGAPNACQAGFHMASLWEIFDPTQLMYDTGRGFKLSDSGQGPPASARGWIRTGNVDDTSNIAGEANCNHYTTASGGVVYGTVANLKSVWDPFPTTVPVAPWFATTDTCSVAYHVWCVQDQ